MRNAEKIKYYSKVIRRALDLLEEAVENEEDISIDEFLNETPQPRKVKKIRKIVEPVEEVVEEVAEEVVEVIEEVEEVVEPSPVPETKVAEPIKTVQPPKNVEPEVNPEQQARQTHIKNLLSIDVWPEAVAKNLEASATKEDQINRANAMLDMMGIHEISNCNFLDFGCGEGWVAKQALLRDAKSSTGYDMITSESWNQNDGVVFTNSFSDVAKHKYGMVMLYDVLDHCQDPEDLMKRIRSVMVPGGKVYVRCHPWTSKHASHLYKHGLNKAYMHLFLTWEELVESGYTPDFTRQEKDPFPAYRWWFENNDFVILEENMRRSPVNEFFFGGDFKNLIMNEQQLDPNDIERFFSDMEVDFVDFQLTTK